MERHVLTRVSRAIETSLGEATVKECVVPLESGGGVERRCYPEYESVVKICEATGRSYRDVYDAVVREIDQHSRVYETPQEFFDDALKNLRP